MNWSQGQWLTRCGMRAVIAKLKSVDQKWVYFGAICCPTTGALVLTTWDHSGNSRGVMGTIDPDFDLIHERYSKET